VGGFLPARVVLLEDLFSLGKSENSLLFLFSLGLACLILLFLLCGSVCSLAFTLNFLCLDNSDGHGSCYNGSDLNFRDLCLLSYTDGLQDALAWRLALVVLLLNLILSGNSDLVSLLSRSCHVFYCIVMLVLIVNFNDVLLLALLNLTGLWSDLFDGLDV
jgi:hypothetical protein